MNKTGQKGCGGSPGAGVWLLGLAAGCLLALSSFTAAQEFAVNGTSNYPGHEYASLDDLLNNLGGAAAGDRIVLYQDDNTVTITSGPTQGTIYIGNGIVADNLTITSDGTTPKVITRADTKTVTSTIGGNGGGFLQVNGTSAGWIPTTGHTVSNLTFNNFNVVSNKTADDFRGGGVILMKGTSGNAITNVTFTNNSVSTHYKSNGASNTVGYGGGGGGAVFLGFQADSNTLTGVTFSGNTVNAILDDDMMTQTTGDMIGGGGLYMVNNSGNTLNTVKFTGNTVNALGSDSGGGGAYLLRATNVELRNTTFTENTVAQTGANENAYGGGLYAKDSTIEFKESNIFAGNKVSADSGDAYGGGLYYSNATNGLVYTGVGTATTVHFEGNKAYTSDGTAAGGAMYVTGRSATISDAVFKDNWAGKDPAGAALYADAKGGAGYFANGATISNSTFTDNRAIGMADAEGGALWVNGDLKLTDVSFFGNVARADTDASSKGGAVYVTGSVDMSVSAGKHMEISGNKAGSHSNSFYINNGGATGSFDLDVGSGGSMALLDPMHIINYGTYNITKTGAGDFKWDGINTIYGWGSSTIDLQGGTIELGDDFSLAADAYTSMKVNIANVDAVKFGLDRSETLAMFDFTNANTTGSASSFTVQDGTKLVTTLGRDIASIDKSYAVVTGLAESEIVGKFVLETSHPEFVTLSNPLRYDSASQTLYADINFRSPFDTNGPNAASVRDPLQEMLNGSKKVEISDAEYLELLRNPTAAYSEIFMEQAHISLDSADRMARTAIDYGLRYPHRNRMRSEEAMVVEEGEYYEEYSSYGGSDYAYPSLALCGPDQGLRFWTGYVGDWRNETAHSGYNGYKVDRHGVLLGVNYDFSDAATLGIYGGYSHIDTKAKRVSSQTKTNSAHFGLQGRLSPLACNRDLSFYGDVTYNYYDNKTERHLGGWSANGSFEQDIFTIGLAVEQVFRLDGFNLTPHLEARYFYLNQDGMNEGGNSITTTSVNGIEKGSFNTRLGVEASKDYELCNGVFTPALNVAWRHEYGNKGYNNTATYIHNNVYMPFNISSSPNDRDSLDLGLAIKGAKQLSSGNRLGLNVAYNLNVSKRSSTHSVYAGLDVGF